LKGLKRSLCGDIGLVVLSGLGIRRNHPDGTEGATMARMAPFQLSSIPAFIEYSMKPLCVVSENRTSLAVHTLESGSRDLMVRCLNRLRLPPLRLYWSATKDYAQYRISNRIPWRTSCCRQYVKAESVLLRKLLSWIGLLTRYLIGRNAHLSGEKIRSVKMQCWSDIISIIVVLKLRRSDRT
jgi:hypothetical protein